MHKSFILSCLPRCKALTRDFINLVVDELGNDYFSNIPPNKKVIQYELLKVSIEVAGVCGLDEATKKEIKEDLEKIFWKI